MPLIFTPLITAGLGCLSFLYYIIAIALYSNVSHYRVAHPIELLTFLATYLYTTTTQRYNAIL
jgi:hypothetical protein